jgi:sugar lactone lactonase YvrE
MAQASRPRIASVHPPAAVAGGRIAVDGPGVGGDGGRLPEVWIGDLPAQVVYASRNRVACLVPPEAAGGSIPVRLDTAPGETASLEVGVQVATGVHQVDSPVIAADGTLFLTYSGTRGESSPVSVFRLRRDGFREPFVTGITNPTSLALDPLGRLVVSSRFDGAVFRVDADGQRKQLAAELGVACGLAFDEAGTLFVGDRSGTIFKVSPLGEVTSFATLPPSVAAFHLGMAPTGDLYVTAPTLATRDAVYRIDRAGTVAAIHRGFGRPQGLAFDVRGTLHVVEALAGASGLYRIRGEDEAEQLVAAPSLVGVAFDPAGGVVVASEDRVYRFERLPEPAPG